MSTNESASYKTLRMNVFLPRDRVDRVENMLVAGMPDFNACADGKDVWVEIKSPMSEPARKDTALLSGQHQLSQDQANWLLRHAKAGGLGFVYIDAPSHRYLISGLQADLINKATHVQLMLMADWSAPVPTPAARWQDLREQLRGL